jgi:hypothetical protein
MRRNYRSPAPVANDADQTVPTCRASLCNFSPGDSKNTCILKPREQSPNQPGALFASKTSLGARAGSLRFQLFSAVLVARKAEEGRSQTPTTRTYLPSHRRARRGGSARSMTPSLIFY